MYNLPEIKIMIIGPREAGRSLLAQRLSGQDEKGKDAIEIYECKVNYQGQEYQLQIWDFSGKEIHHATHQLFFTPQSLYILVDDTKASERYIQDEYYKYWFEVVKRYGEQSPMIIVQNEKGGRSKEIPIKEIQDLYPFFMGAFPLDLKECRDEEINNLREHILRFGQKVVQTFGTFSLEEFRNSIINLSRSKRNHIHVDEIKTLCNNHCGSDKYPFGDTLKQLHNLGIIFHFERFESLANWVILDRNWLVTSIYKILDSKTVERQDGRITLNDVKLELDHPEYTGTHRKVVELMEKFYLCYTVENDVWMAPQLFREEPQKMVQWSEKNYIKNHYAEFTFLPKGLVDQLLVKSYTGIVLFEPWRGGFCFDQHNTRVIVAEQWVEKKILFRYFTDDNIPKVANFINGMLKDVAKVHQVGFHLLVPCTCESCKNSDSPSLYRYEEDLLRRKKNEHMEIECRRTYKKVLIDNILNANIEYLPSKSKTTTPQTKLFAMKGLISTLIVLLVLFSGLYWFFNYTNAGAMVKIELFGIKVEGTQGGEPDQEKGITSTGTISNCNVAGRIKIGGQFANASLVSIVKFSNEITRTSSIKNGGVYRFENFPCPENDKATLEVTLNGIDSPLEIVVDLKTRNGNEVTYQDAIFEGNYDKKNNKLTNVIYNGQTIIVKGNGNTVNQTMQKGNNNSNASQQGVTKQDTAQKK